MLVLTGDDERTALVAGVDRLEEVARRRDVEGQVPHLVDDEQGHAVEPDGGFQAVLTLRRREPGDPGRCGGEERGVAGQAGADARAVDRMVLPVPGGTRNTTLYFAATKSSWPRCSTTVFWMLVWKALLTRVRLVGSAHARAVAPEQPRERRGLCC